MDAAYTARGMPPLPPLRADTTPLQQTVKTDLPQEKAVSIMREGQSTTFDGSDTRSQNAAQAATAERLAAETRRKLAREVHVEVDEATQDFIYQTVESESGDVITQFPSETLMKIRAYVREEYGSADGTPEVELPGVKADGVEQPPVQHIEKFI
jgi:uncharacterized FlaG/YvyC family protein